MATRLLALNLDSTVERIAAGVLLKLGDTAKSITKNPDGSCLIETERDQIVVHSTAPPVWDAIGRALSVPQKINTKPMEALLEHIESLPKPNFLQIELVLLELDAQPKYFKQLQTLMEKSFKLPPFDPKKPLESQLPFNATQFHLGFEAESLETPHLRRLLETNYKLTPIDHLETLEGCLEMANTVERPNFTQLLLRMQELGAERRSWCALRRIMESKFALESMDQFTK